MLSFAIPVSKRPHSARRPPKLISPAERAQSYALVKQRFRLVNWPQDNAHSRDNLFAQAPIRTYFQNATIFEGEQEVNRNLNETYFVEHTWESHFEELMAFLRSNGHTCVNRRDSQYHSLYMWLRAQRYEWRRGRLPWKYYCRLSSIPEFVWDKQEERWRQNLFLLISFLEKHGHCSVPLKLPGSGNSTRLARWVAKQRHLSKYGLLSDDRRRRLEGIGFQFSPEEDRFHARLRELVSFASRHGHPNVPRSWPENVSLARWVDSVRLRWRRGKLPLRYHRLLTSIGFSFAPQDHLWEVNFNALKRFTAIHGHCWPSFLENRHLNAWLLAQKRIYRTGTLAPDRELKLYQLGVDLRPKKKVFQERFDSIREFYLCHGHYNVPHQSSLKTWIVQFQVLGRQRLSRSSQKQLDSINFPWNYQAMLEG